MWIYSSGTLFAYTLYYLTSCWRYSFLFLSKYLFAVVYVRLIFDVNNKIFVLKIDKKFSDIATILFEKND